MENANPKWLQTRWTRNPYAHCYSCLKHYIWNFEDLGAALRSIWLQQRRPSAINRWHMGHAPNYTNTK